MGRPNLNEIIRRNRQKLKRENQEKAKMTRPILSSLNGDQLQRPPTEQEARMMMDQQMIQVRNGLYLDLVRLVAQHPYLVPKQDDDISGDSPVVTDPQRIVMAASDLADAAMTRIIIPKAPAQ
jgi:hypothetical protein